MIIDPESLSLVEGVYSNHTFTVPTNTTDPTEIAILNQEKVNLMSAYNIHVLVEAIANSANVKLDKKATSVGSETDFNATVIAGIYYVADNVAHVDNGCPVTGKGGFIRIVTEESGNVVKQLWYPLDTDNVTVWSRTGAIVDSVVTWSSWQSIYLTQDHNSGSTRETMSAFAVRNLFASVSSGYTMEILTSDKTGSSGVWYLGYEDHVLTLPDPTALPEGAKIGREQVTGTGVTVYGDYLQILAVGSGSAGSKYTIFEVKKNAAGVNEWYVLTAENYENDVNVDIPIGFYPATSILSDWVDSAWSNVSSARPTLDSDQLNVPVLRVGYNTTEGIGLLTLDKIPAKLENLLIEMSVQPLDSGAAGSNMGWKVDYCRYRNGVAESPIATVSLGATEFQAEGITQTEYQIALSTLGAQAGDQLAIIIYPDVDVATPKETDWMVVSVGFKAI